MRIAVIEHAGSGDYAEYIFSLIEEKATLHNYQVKAWSNSVPAFQQRLAENAVIPIFIESNSSFLLRWLYRIKIPSIIKKSKATIVIDLNGVASKKIKIPQFVIAGQALFNKDAKQLNRAENFASKKWQQSLKNAKRVLSYSIAKTNELTNVEKEKILALPFTAPEIFKTFEWHEKIMIKAQHADNKEYFVSVIEDNDVDGFVLLLQAYSRFKKWQQSSMQLLILPKFESLGEAIRSKHATYKFREDVRLIENTEEKEIAAIIASAYAYIHIATVHAHLLIVSIALQCSLPVISFEDADVQEYAAGAGLYCNEKNAGGLGNILIQLYKDENLHARLKEAAKTQATNLNREEYKDQLWQLLETAANN